jgi:hypothetical protein
MAVEPSELPRGRGRVYRRFAGWRNAHPGVRLPIPPRLCKAAAQVARVWSLSNRPGSAFGVRQAAADGGIGWSSRTPRFAQGQRNAPVGDIPSCGGQGVGPEGESRSVGGFTAVIPGSGRVLRDLQQHLHTLKCAYVVRTGSKQGHFVPLGIRS